MASSDENPPARVTLREEGGVLEVALGGSWRLGAPGPRWRDLEVKTRPSVVRPTAEAVGRWDSSVLVFLGEIERWCAVSGVDFDPGALPQRMRQLLSELSAVDRVAEAADRSETFVSMVGESTRDTLRQARDILQFVGECSMSAFRLPFHPGAFRWRDCMAEMQECGAMALPIISLISFLVGVTLAYSGAVVLRRFGGDIYIADILGVAMAREMGALMAAVVMAGRTGAAFAAQIGSMKANEEIDALSTLGIPAVRFLVLPRILALGIMMPLLAIYANCLGVVGGMVVARTILDISPTAFWVEMLTIVDAGDLTVGIIKSIAFGLLVGLSGCLRGLQAERNAAGVGRAATSAVVTAILLIIVADALFAVVFEAVGL